MIKQLLRGVHSPDDLRAHLFLPGADEPPEPPASQPPGALPALFAPSSSCEGETDCSEGDVYLKGDQVHTTDQRLRCPPSPATEIKWQDTATPHGHVSVGSLNGKALLVLAPLATLAALQPPVAGDGVYSATPTTGSGRRLVPELRYSGEVVGPVGAARTTEKVAAMHAPAAKKGAYLTKVSLPGTQGGGLRDGARSWIIDGAKPP
jgi:hypothetical protein